MDNPGPSSYHLPLIPAPYHPDVEVYRLTAADRVRDTISIYLICPPASVRITTSKENNHLRSIYYFGGTTRTTVAFDCLLAGWQVFEVTPISGRVDLLMYDEFEKHWCKGVRSWGGFDNGENSEEEQDEMLLDVTVNLRGWLEHLPRIVNIDDISGDYMDRVYWHNEVARDAGEAKGKQVMDKVAFAIDSPYSSIAILAFSALYFYCVCLGFIQFCHKLAPWTKWLFN